MWTDLQRRCEGQGTKLLAFFTDNPVKEVNGITRALPSLAGKSTPSPLSLSSGSSGNEYLSLPPDVEFIRCGRREDNEGVDKALRVLEGIIGKLNLCERAGGDAYVDIGFDLEWNLYASDGNMRVDVIQFAYCKHDKSDPVVYVFHVPSILKNKASSSVNLDYESQRDTHKKNCALFYTQLRTILNHRRARFVGKGVQLDVNRLWNYLRSFGVRTRSTETKSSVIDLGSLAHQKGVRTYLMNNGHEVSAKQASLSVLSATILGLPIDKSLRRSNWANALSEELWKYAAIDAWVRPVNLPALLKLTTHAGKFGNLPVSLRSPGSECGAFGQG